MEKISGTQDDMTILMELFQYAGKDVNLVEMFKMFKIIHQKAGYDQDLPKAMFDEEIRDNFNRAVG